MHNNPEQDMNVCNIFNGNASYSCCNISLETKNDNLLVALEENQMT